jgi:hypothetical protein
MPERKVRLGLEADPELGLRVYALIKGVGLRSLNQAPTDTPREALIRG